MDVYNFTDVADGQAIQTNARHGEVSRSLIDLIKIKPQMADISEISTDDATTSDHGMVCAHIRWDEGEGAKVSRKVTG